MLSRILIRYEEKLAEKPYVTNILTSATIGCVGDFLCQTLIEKKNEIDYRRNLSFTVFCGAYQGGVCNYLYTGYPALFNQWRMRYFTMMENKTLGKSGGFLKTNFDFLKTNFLKDNVMKSKGGLKATFENAKASGQTAAGNGFTNGISGFSGSIKSKLFANSLFSGVKSAGTKMSSPSVPNSIVQKLPRTGVTGGGSSSIASNFVSQSSQKALIQNVARQNVAKEVAKKTVSNSEKATVSRGCSSSKFTPLQLAIAISLFDNFVHVPVGYMPAFYYGVGSLQGHTMDEIWTTFSSQYVEACVACQVVWTPLQLINFMLIPPQFRILFVNAGCLAWTVIIDMISNRAEHSNEVSMEIKNGSGMATKNESGLEIKNESGLLPNNTHSSSSESQFAKHGKHEHHFHHLFDHLAIFDHSSFDDYDSPSAMCDTFNRKKAVKPVKEQTNTILEKVHNTENLGNAKDEVKEFNKSEKLTATKEYNSENVNTAKEYSDRLGRSHSLIPSRDRVAMSL